MVETEEAAFYGCVNSLGAGRIGSLSDFICLIKLASDKADKDLS